MKYEIREDKDKKAIFDESGKQISDWWDYIWVNGLVYGESDFYLVRRQYDHKKAIFHKSGVQASEWWPSIFINGLVYGNSNEYTFISDDSKEITLIFDRTKFIVDKLKEKMK
ncbi:MAG: hypothetical protein PF569_03825 [Candidatus Woesearchaeota archaeon]|jgi:hypothetical protein|nr:hypothetical protein [Candidatus Woesearchaeota archaeon]